MSVFQETKILLVDTLGLSKDALHIYVSLIVFFGTAAIFRLPLRDPTAVSGADRRPARRSLGHLR
jgi:hypothetical protein